MQEAQPDGSTRYWQLHKALSENIVLHFLWNTDSIIEFRQHSCSEYSQYSKTFNVIKLDQYAFCIVIHS